MLKTRLSIAGTYTPICLLALHGGLGRKLLIMIWSAAGAGFLQSLFFVGLPKKVSAVLYVAMGWMAARYSKVSWSNTEEFYQLISAAKYQNSILASALHLCFVLSSKTQVLNSKRYMLDGGH